LIRGVLPMRSSRVAPKERAVAIIKAFPSFEQFAANPRGRLTAEPNPV
jgi:hypothetical protein